MSLKERQEKGKEIAAEIANTLRLHFNLKTKDVKEVVDAVFSELSTDSTALMRFLQVQEVNLEELNRRKEIISKNNGLIDFYRDLAEDYYLKYMDEIE